MKRHKGAFSVIGLIFMFIMLVVFGAMYPVLNSVITDILPEADTATAALVTLIPFIILVLIVLSSFISSRTEEAF